MLRHADIRERRDGGTAGALREPMLAHEKLDVYQCVVKLLADVSAAQARFS
jgi:hypothetical protein